MFEHLDRMHAESLEDPDGFWGKAAGCIDWFKPWDSVLSYNGDGSAVWFAGAETNTCWNALDRHVANGRGDQLALIYDSPLAQDRRSLTFGELKDQVARFAGALTGLGVTKGDRVLIYLPNIPEAAVAMLACARIGAVHSVVFGGFAARELATRVSDAGAKLVITASCGIEPGRIIPYMPVVDEALALASVAIETCIVVQRAAHRAALRLGRDIDWDTLADAEPVDCVPVRAEDPLYIIYTSGTTGQPKGIVRPSGGNLVALCWSLINVYDVKPGERFWAASDIGWVVGHSYMVYGQLILGATAIMYEGKPIGTPDPGAFWRIISEYGVETMFVAPTAIRAIRQQDPEGAFLKGYDLSKFRALFLAGERCDPSTLQWIRNLLGTPVIDHWWQTETGWPIAANPLGIEEIPIKPGSVSRPLPGWEVHILNDDGIRVDAGEVGAIACKLPLPPGVATTLWNAPERYRTAYLDRFPGYYHTGDAGFVDDEGYLYVMTRTDDVINVAGHRLSTGAIEEVIASHPAVAECAVVGLADPLKGHVPLGLLVLNKGTDRTDDEIIAEIVSQVRREMGAVVAFKRAAIVQRLPKTRSGKILRATLAQMANGVAYPVPATIEDAAVLGEVEASLAQSGICPEPPGV